MSFLGIDPGAQGALALLDVEGNVLDLRDLPYNKKAKFVDLFELKSYLNSLLQNYETIHCFHEDCQYTPAIKGSGAFTFGKNVGASETLLVALGIPYQLVKPQKWKKHFSLIGKEKSDSIILAKQMFPDFENFLLKSKDGRAEALLIAEYCRRTFLGKVI